MRSNILPNIRQNIRTSVVSDGYIYTGISDLIGGEALSAGRQAFLSAGLTVRSNRVRSASTIFLDTYLKDGLFDSAALATTNRDGREISYMSRVYNQSDIGSILQSTWGLQPKVANDGATIFDGVDNYMKSAVQFTNGDNFSVSFSFRNKGGGDNQRIICHENSTTLVRSWSVLTRKSANELRLIVWKPGGSIVTIDSGDVYDGVERRVTISYDSAVGFTCSIDGVQKNISANTTGTLSISAIDLSVGAQENGVSAFAGSVDDVIFYQGKTLTVAEHAIDYDTWSQNKFKDEWWKTSYYAQLDYGKRFVIFDFVNNKYTVDGYYLAPSFMLSSHSSDILALNSGGNYELFPPNEACITDLGLRGYEGSITQLALYSCDYTNASWAKGAGVTNAISVDQSPIPSIFWSNLTALAGSNSKSVTTAIAGAIGNHLCHIIAKKGTHRYVGLRPLGGVATYATFDFDTGTWSNLDAGYVTFQSEISTGVWELAIRNDASSNAGNTTLGFAIVDSAGSEVWASVGGESIDVCYLGAYNNDTITPPVVTTNIALTRNGPRDTIALASVDEGIDVAFVIDVKEGTNQSINALMTIHDGSISNRALLYMQNGKVQLRVTTGGVVQAQIIIDNTVNGIQAYVLSMGTNYIKVRRVGGAIGFEPTFIYFAPTSISLLSYGYIGNGTNGVIKEFYTRSGNAVNDTTFAEFETFITARLGAY